jgi:hypothetical protein
MSRPSASTGIARFLTMSRSLRSLNLNRWAISAKVK